MMIAIYTITKKWILYTGMLFAFIIVPFSIIAKGEVKNENVVPVFLNCNYMSGHIFQHDKDVSHTIRGYVNGISTSISDFLVLRTNLEDRQQQLAFDLGFIVMKHNYDFLGETIGFTIGKSTSIITHKKLTFSVNWGFGIGINTKVYSEQNNKNLASGTHLALLNHTEIRITYPVYKKYYAVGSFVFNHMSNGGSIEPNLGYNILTSEIGIGYNLRSKKLADKSAINPNQREYYYHLLGGYFLSNTDSWGDNKYSIYAAHFLIERYLSQHHSFLLSFDYCHDRTVPYPVVKEDFHSDNNYNFLGISAGFSWKLTFIELAGTTGIDYYVPWHNRNKWYSQLYIKSYLLKGTYLFVGLKAHRFNAAHFESGIGVRL